MLKSQRFGHSVSWSVGQLNKYIRQRTTASSHFTMREDISANKNTFCSRRRTVRNSLRYNRRDNYILVGRRHAGSSSKVRPRCMGYSVTSKGDLRVIANKGAVGKLNERIRTFSGQPRLGPISIGARFRHIVHADGSRRRRWWNYTARIVIRADIADRRRRRHSVIARVIADDHFSVVTGYSGKHLVCCTRRHWSYRRAVDRNPRRAQ